MPAADDEDDGGEFSHTHGGHFANGQTHDHVFHAPHHHGDGAYNSGSADHMHQHDAGKLKMVHEHPYNGDHEHTAPAQVGLPKAAGEP